MIFDTDAFFTVNEMIEVLLNAKAAGYGEAVVRYDFDNEYLVTEVLCMDTDSFKGDAKSILLYSR